MIIDTHCHLNNDDLYPNANEIILNAKAVGVEKFIVVGWDKTSSFRAIELAERYDCVFATVGFHPSDVIDLSEEDFNATMELGKHPKVVAIGEIGLDYYWEKDEAKKNIQKEYFIRQIKIANKLGKPISIHNRDAYEDCLKILNEYKPEHGGVMHCYSGSVEELNNVLKLGLLIGLDGPVTFKNAKKPKEVAKIVPLDKLIVETDCPFLSPHPLRGTINEPKNLPYIVEEIALQKGLTVEEISAETTRNAQNLFKL